MSSIKLDPAFRRDRRGPRVGGFEPAPLPQSKAGSWNGLAVSVFLCGIFGAALVCAWHWLMLEF